MEVLWEGCTDGRNYLCLHSHVWAELAQDAPGQERREHLNVMVTLCPLVANLRLGLAQACLWHLSGKQAPGLKAWRWEMSRHIRDPVTRRWGPGLVPDRTGAQGDSHKWDTMSAKAWGRVCRL